MSYISVLTFNLCWEAIYAKNKMKSCKINGKNICVATIVKIITKYSLETLKNNGYDVKLFDFIGLQEINPYGKDWLKILYPVLEEKRVFKKYKFIGNEKHVVKKSGCIILYNKKKYVLIYEYSYNITDKQDDARPCLIVVLKNKKTKKNYIVVNCHFPHFYNNIEENVKNKFMKLHYILSKLCFEFETTSIVIMGDFNHEFNQNFNLYLPIDNDKVSFYDNMKNRYSIKTCCNSNPDGKFSFWSDHIFSTLGPCRYFTYNNEAKTKNSDHKPLYSVIQETN